MRFSYGFDISPTRTVTPEGFLSLSGCRVACIGGRDYTPEEIKQVIPCDGKVKVIRSKESLFNPITLASFEGKPVSLEHPPGVEMFDANTWKNYIVGVMLHVREGQGEDAGCLVADLLLYDKDAINAVMSGSMTELSLGYNSEITDIGGGVGVESPLVGNHVALVPRGRCGSLCAIKDAKPEGEEMFNFKKDAEPTGDASAEAIKALQEQINALQEQLASMKPVVTDSEPEAQDEPKSDAEATEEVKPEGEAVEATEEQKTDEAEVEEPKQDEDQPVEVEQTEQAEEWKPTKEAIAQIVLEVLKAQAQMTNQPQQTVVDECVKKDAATIAPNLDANTPNLALKAIETYAKTANGKQIVEAHGGMSVIKDSAESFLKSIAIAERARALASIGEGKKDAKSEPRPSYFAMAKNLWK